MDLINSIIPVSFDNPGRSLYKSYPGTVHIHHSVDKSVFSDFYIWQMLVYISGRLHTPVELVYDNWGDGVDTDVVAGNRMDARVGWWVW